MEFQSFVRVYSHLQRLMEEYPAGVPRDGIRLSFRDGRALGAWNEAEHRLTLPAQYYGDAARLQQLENRLMRMADAGHTPDGCASPEYVVSHEFGHCLRHRLDGTRYAQWWMQCDKVGLGTNGGRTYAEGFAEGFAAIEHVPAERWSPTVRLLHEMLREDGF